MIFNCNQKLLFFHSNSFLGVGLDMDGGMAYCYYKDGESNPTFLYFLDGMREENY
jgi:hypothetical protein